MGRSLSPMLRRELENLEKDGDSRKSAMKALKLFVKDMDSKAIPIFLAQVSETKQAGLSPGEHTISLYEVLARVHGPKIVPQIDNIMSTIVKTLTLSAGAFALHQACSKVVPAIARYAIDPTTAEDRKRHVIRRLCEPLSNCLLGSQESLSSGAALCLHALVESDNWRFASTEMVNVVCQRVAGALEMHLQTNAHMALVAALAKHNSLVVEAYGRLLIQSGLRILDAGFTEENSQKRFSAIHMVSSLLRYLDPRSVSSELESVIEEMDKCQSDKMAFVSGAALEVLQNAKRMRSNGCSRLERDVSSSTRSRPRDGCSSETLTASPESQTVDSFAGYDYGVESPYSVNHGHQTLDYSPKGVSRRLWTKRENGLVDVSLKDGIFSCMARGHNVSPKRDETLHNHGECYENFAGFVQESAENEVMGSNTASPRRSNSFVKVDDMRIFSTPRKLIRSLQDVDDFDVCLSEKTRSPMSRTYARRRVSMHGQDGMNCEEKREGSASGSELFHGSSESVSSTADVFDPTGTVPVEEQKHHSFAKGTGFRLFVGLFAVFVVLYLLVIWIGDDHDDRYAMVPT